MGRLLREAGCRRRSPRPTIARTPLDKAEQMGALAEALCSTGLDEVILCADEVDVHLHPKIQAEWMAPGVRKTVVTPGQNKKRYLAGAYEALDKELITVEGERKNSALFIDLLDKVDAHYPEASTIHLVVDNYSIHRSQLTKKALERLGGRIKLHFLPPYSPDCNPIERVWCDLHAAVTRNHRCADIESLMGEVRRWLAVYSCRGAHEAGLIRAA